MLSLEEILERSEKAHQGKYHYSHVTKSFGTKTIMKIICPIHGLFEQKAALHINGCPHCRKEALKYCAKNKNERFINDAKEIHFNRYDYDNTYYESYKEKVLITCNKCAIDLLIFPIENLPVLLILVSV